jgi:serine/threonine protein kinase
MTLAAGTRLGAYEILAKLGEGGMGEVYRARDTTLGREVALKILPETLATDAERLARFEREARTLATLNHPRIAQVYGFDDQRALIMELVDGEDLSVRIARGPIPLDEALPIARQIAEALEAAHDAGIVHRDLKPANIKLRADGSVKVLDFGLAKASGASGASGAGDALNSPTITSPAALTMGGMILGTAAYMAPEQAKGKPVDRRADIWAFGCVLYEMLTGQRAFPGEDISETLASILAREPDFGALPPGLPPALRALIVRCLARDPKERVANISTALYVLTSGLDVATSPVAATVAPVSRAVWRRALPAVAAAVVAGAIGAVVSARWPRAETPKPVARFSFEIPKGQIFTNNNRQMIAVSPDGSRIVYVGGMRLNLRHLSDPEARPISGSDLKRGVLNPVFSPDGEWVAFWSGTELMKIPVGGGTPITLYRESETGTRFGLTWDETGIVFTRPQGIVRVSADGGEPAVLVPAPEGEAIYRPQVLPGGRHVLYTSAPEDQLGAYATGARIVVQTIGSGEPATIVQGVDGRYLPTGHLLYRSGTTMMAARLDLDRLTLDGSPVAVAQAAVSSGAIPLATHLDVSASGTMVYVAGSGSSGQDLALLDRRGQITRRFGLPDGAYATPRVSPDGRYVAYSDRGSDPNIWIVNLDGASRPRRFTFSGRNRFPIWSADGQHVAFQSDRGGDQSIYWQRADGSGEAERLTTAPAGAAHTPESFSPDGEYLLLRSTAGEVSTLWLWSRRDRSLVRVEGESARASNASFSPDGRWIAYTAPADRAPSVSVVRPFPLTAARYQVPIPEQSANMAIHPVWSRSAPELIYSVGPGLLATTTVDTRSAVEFGAPSVVQIPGAGDPLFRGWDLTPDGQHFVRVIETDLDGTLQPPIHVVMNWTEELKALLPAR